MYSVHQLRCTLLFIAFPLMLVNAAASAGALLLEREVAVSIPAAAIVSPHTATFAENGDLIVAGQVRHYVASTP